MLREVNILETISLTVKATHLYLKDQPIEHLHESFEFWILSFSHLLQFLKEIQGFIFAFDIVHIWVFFLFFGCFFLHLDEILNFLQNYQNIDDVDNSSFENFSIFSFFINQII